MAYPNTLDNLPTVSAGQLITAAYQNSQTNAINAVETELGILPKGPYSDVAQAVSRVADIGLCEGRLTLSTATPVTTSDVTAATTVYFTPYQGNRIALYDGTNWKVLSFSEVSVAVPATLFRLFDVFAYDNAGAVAMETVDWNQTTGAITDATNASPIVITSTAHGLSNGNVVGVAGVGGNTAPNGKTWYVYNVTANTFELTDSSGNGAYTSGGTWYKIPNTRATALSLQNGVHVKSGAATRRYLGTAMTAGTSGQAEDSTAKRLLWNCYNRKLRPLNVKDANTSWTYTSSIRSANGNYQNSVTLVLGLSEDAVLAHVYGSLTNSSGGNYASVGIGINDFSTSSAQIQAGAENSAGQLAELHARYRGFPGIGMRQMVWLEYSQAVGTSTWYGSNNGNSRMSGLIVEVMA